MRILLANSTAFPQIGGVENSLRYIGRELLKQGHEVGIFCFQSDSEEPLKDSIEDISIYRRPYSLRKWPHRRLAEQVERAREAIPTLVKEFRPDEIWCRSVPVGLGISSGFRGRLVQILSTSARMDSQGHFLQTAASPISRRLIMAGLYPLALAAMRRIERALLPRCQPVVFSQNMRDQLIWEYGDLADPPKVIPPGVDAETFSPATAARWIPEIENAYGLTSEERFVLFVGRLSAAKNLPLLFRAMVRFRDHGSRLVLVGDGREENRLRALSVRLGLKGRVLFVGRQADVLPGFYGLAGVTVLPTTIESFGQVYLESMACGTPVVGFGGARRIRTATSEIVQDGATGGVVAKVGAKNLAEGIEKIVRLPHNSYQEMSTSCVENTVRRFSWKDFVETVLSGA